jgi:putative oxidoreductase
MSTIAIPRSRAQAAFLWTLQIVTAALFLMAGLSKLAGAAAMVQLFATIGVGQWFQYVTGIIEVVAAALLLVPSLAFFGALLLIPTMVGAILTHLFIVGGNPSMPIALLASATAIAAMKWSGR